MIGPIFVKLCDCLRTFEVIIKLKLLRNSRNLCHKRDHHFNCFPESLELFRFQPWGGLSRIRFSTEILSRLLPLLPLLPLLFTVLLPLLLLLLFTVLLPLLLLLLFGVLLQKALKRLYSHILDLTLIVVTSSLGWSDHFAWHWYLDVKQVLHDI